MAHMVWVVVVVVVGRKKREGRWVKDKQKMRQLCNWMTKGGGGNHAESGGKRALFLIRQLPKDFSLSQDERMKLASSPPTRSIPKRTPPTEGKYLPVCAVQLFFIPGGGREQTYFKRNNSQHAATGKSQPFSIIISTRKFELENWIKIDDDGRDMIDKTASVVSNLFFGCFGLWDNFWASGGQFVWRKITWAESDHFHYFGSPPLLPKNLQFPMSSSSQFRQGIISRWGRRRRTNNHHPRNHLVFSAMSGGRRTKTVLGIKAVAGLGNMAHKFDSQCTYNDAPSFLLRILPPILSNGQGIAS